MDKQQAPDERAGTPTPHAPPEPHAPSNGAGSGGGGSGGYWTSQTGFPGNILPRIRPYTMRELMSKFPDDQTAMRWFEGERWRNGRKCGMCLGTKTCKSKHPNMPYWCGKCRRYFSVRTGTVMERSNIPYQKWAFAMHLYMNHPKGISSIQLSKELGIGYHAAWFMSHRLRAAWAALSRGNKFIGPVEIDEVYLGGIDRWRHVNKKHHTSKMPVVGMRDRYTGMVRARPVPDTTSLRLSSFIHENTIPDAYYYTDENRAYDFLWRHDTVNHTEREYGRGDVHTNGIESFWALLRRGYHGTYHHMSKKHMHRYVGEFTGRFNVHKAGLDYAGMMGVLAQNMFGLVLPYKRLIA